MADANYCFRYISVGTNGRASDNKQTGELSKTSWRDDVQIDGLRAEDTGRANRSGNAALARRQQLAEAFMTTEVVPWQWRAAAVPEL